MSRKDLLRLLHLQKELSHSCPGALRLKEEENNNISDRYNDVPKNSVLQPGTNQNSSQSLIWRVMIRQMGDGYYYEANNNIPKIEYIFEAKDGTRHSIMPYSGKKSLPRGFPTDIPDSCNSPKPCIRSHREKSEKNTSFSSSDETNKIEELELNDQQEKAEELVYMIFIQSFFKPIVNIINGLSKLSEMMGFMVRPMVSTLLKPILYLYLISRLPVYFIPLKINDVYRDHESSRSFRKSAPMMDDRFKTPDRSKTNALRFG
mgnify:CR=1 FL=1